jgi:hypothetical protein
MIAATWSTILVDLGHGLREAFFMFWETFWALALGLTLSGVVQAFISKEQMRAKLGNHGPAATARATWYGMVSSSCSYAASAMAKSLFAKGADFTTSMVFMVASTNLVIELGIIMIVLLGWQFAVAEFVGGPIMIVLLASAGGVVFTSSLVALALKRVRGESGEGHDHAAMVMVSPERQDQLESESLRSKFRSPAAWSDASSYAVADATMLRRELAIGYLVAGFLAVLVPSRAWNDLFLHGHGFWTVAENALVGPLIAVISWVCSIGNVPLAAALWSGGISFGGVIAFIFADLIAMPLILVYRKFYGWKLTLRVVGLFYVIMVIAGLATEGIFGAFGGIPSRRTFSIAAAHWEWNYTTFLNIAFIFVAASMWWLARNRDRFGGGRGYDIDPVCGMQVRESDAPAHAVHDGHSYSFCSNRCEERFQENPARYVSSGGHGRSMEMSHGDTGEVMDPVCGMTVEPATAAAHRSVGGRDFWFCGEGCAQKFEQNPSAFSKSD